MCYNISTVKERNKLEINRPRVTVGESEKVMKYTVYSKRYLSHPVIALETNNLQEVIEYYVYRGRQAEKLHDELDGIIKRSNNIKAKRVKGFKLRKENGTPVSIDDLIQMYVTIYEEYQKGFNTSMSGLQRMIFDKVFQLVWKKIPRLDGEVTIVGEFGRERD
jgi:hypothetical protein